MKEVIWLSLLTVLLFACKGEGSVDREKPKFARSSTLPVLLRYKFSKGRIDRYSITSVIVVKIAGMGKTAGEIPIRMTMGYQIKGSGKNSEGNYELTMSISRVSMDGPDESMRFDSADKSSISRSSVGVLFEKIVGKPIRMTITPRGKTVRADMDTMLSRLSGHKALLHAINAMIANIERYGMPQFPAAPVKVGDRFKSIGYSRDSGGTRQMNVSLAFTVESISADGTKVLLKPDMKIDFVPGRAEVKMKAPVMDGWMLFNAGAGRVERSKMKFTISVRFQGMRESRDMDMAMDVKLE